MSDQARELPVGLQRYLEQRFGAAVERAQALATDAGGTTTAKVEGYGAPVRLWLRQPDGTTRQCVFRMARANEFGHDRCSDRAQEQLLAWETFGLLPRHARAIDVGTIEEDGSLSTLSRAGELFLITEWVEGTPYADDLRRLAHGGDLTALDVARAQALASHLARQHQRLTPDRVKWERCLRDTVGSGEGLFGICDAYGSEWADILVELEQRAVAYRWKLKSRSHRLSRTHGDFHPFNLVFREGVDFSALDAARGAAGEPADDVSALTINYVFFAIEHRDRWQGTFSTLWDTFWSTYLELSADRELLECAAPFLAWRAAVVACPRFYPHLSSAARASLLALALKALEGDCFDPSWVHGFFR